MEQPWYNAGAFYKFNRSQNVYISSLTDQLLASRWPKMPVRQEGKQSRNRSEQSKAQPRSYDDSEYDNDPEDGRHNSDDDDSNNGYHQISEDEAIAIRIQKGFFPYAFSKSQRITFYDKMSSTLL